MVTLLLVIALGCVLIGVPFAFSLLTGIVISTMVFEPSSLSNLPAEMLGNINDPLLIAIPILVVAGEMLSVTNAMGPLVDALDIVCGRMRGSTALACVGASLFFAGSTGSTAAESAAVAASFREPMLSRGYTAKYIATLVAAATAVGVVFPPSLAMILYSDVLQYPVTKLWVAGLEPGIITGVLIAVVGLVIARRTVPKDEVMPAGSGTGAAGGGRSTRGAVSGGSGEENLGVLAAVQGARGRVVRAVPLAASLLLPGFVLGGIYSGVLTLSEVAAALVLLVVLYGLLVSRVGVAPLSKAVRRGGERAGAVFAIVVAARLFATILIEHQTIVHMINFVGGLHLSRFLLLLAVNIALIVAGVLMDSLSLIIIAAPILIEIVEPYGVSPLHLAFIMALNVEVAVVHPPFGGNLYAVSAATGVSIGKVAVGIIPYVGVLLLMVAVVTYVPLPGFMWN